MGNLLFFLSLLEPFPGSLTNLAHSSHLLMGNLLFFLSLLEPFPGNLANLAHASD